MNYNLPPPSFTHPHSEYAPSSVSVSTSSSVSSSTSKRSTPYNSNAASNSNSFHLSLDHSPSPASPYTPFHSSSAAAAASQLPHNHPYMPPSLSHNSNNYSPHARPLYYHNSHDQYRSSPTTLVPAESVNFDTLKMSDHSNHPATAASNSIMPNLPPLTSSSMHAASITNTTPVLDNFRALSLPSPTVATNGHSLENSTPFKLPSIDLLSSSLPHGNNNNVNRQSILSSSTNTTNSKRSSFLTTASSDYSASLSSNSYSFSNNSTGNNLFGSGKHEQYSSSFNNSNFKNISSIPEDSVDPLLRVTSNHHQINNSQNQIRNAYSRSGNNNSERPLPSLPSQQQPATPQIHDPQFTKNKERDILSHHLHDNVINSSSSSSPFRQQSSFPSSSSFNNNNSDVYSIASSSVASSNNSCSSSSMLFSVPTTSTLMKNNSPLPPLPSPHQQQLNKLQKRMQQQLREQQQQSNGNSKTTLTHHPSMPQLQQQSAYVSPFVQHDNGGSSLNHHASTEHLANMTSTPSASAGTPRHYHNHNNHSHHDSTNYDISAINTTSNTTGNKNNKRKNISPTLVQPPKVLSSASASSNSNGKCSSSVSSLNPNSNSLMMTGTFSTTSTAPTSSSSSTSSKEKASSNNISTSISKYTSTIKFDTSPEEERKYACKTCGRKFKTSGHVSRHSRIHTGERKHVCPVPGCGARFARHDNCMQHFKTHENLNGKTAERMRLKEQVSTKKMNIKALIW